MKKIILFILLVQSSFSTAQERFHRIDSLLTYLFENDKFMGSVSLQEGEKVIFSKAYGFADVEAKISAEKNTKYKIGSITKIFTATIMMQLMEEKKLHLNTKLNRFFPKVANAEKITISDLLHHRTGIKDYINQDTLSVEEFQSKDIKKVILDKINSYESIFEPNSQFLYSNSNYYLLGEIIEKITKKSYAENVTERIANKIGLENTYYPTSAINTSQKESFSYLFDGENWKKIDEWTKDMAYSAGEIVSTPEDLTQFLHQLFNGKLVSKKSLEEMKTLKNGYGLALMQFPFGERKFYGHTGGIEGFRSVVGHYPTDNLTLSVIVNGDNYNRNDIIIGILSIYYKIPYPFPQFVTIDENLINSYSGVYASTEIPLKITIFGKEGKLLAQATGQSAFELTPKSETEFIFASAGIAIQFKNNTFVLHQGGAKFNFTKE